MHQKNTLNTILWWGISAGIFLLPFIPLIVTKGMFFPFVTGKNFFFRIIVELILGGWLILAWRDARYRLNFSWVLGALLAFFGVIALADIFGKDFLRSFWSNYERMEGLITLLHLFAYFVVLGGMLKTRALWKWFLGTSLGVSMFVSLFAVFQLLGKIPINQGSDRVDATLGNATYLGGYLLVHVFIAALLFVKERNVILRSLYSAIFILDLFILFNTSTRGAIIGLFAGAFLTTALIALFGRKESSLVRKVAIGALVAVFIAGGGLFALRGTSIIKATPLERITTISLAEGTSRFLIWNMVLEGAKERPVLGWGQDNFMLLFNKYYDPKMYMQEPWFDRAHSVIFDWLAAGGFLGLLAYLALFLASLYALWVYPWRKTLSSSLQKGDGLVLSFAERSILTGLLGAYFIQNVFVFDTIASYFLFFSVLGFIHAHSVESTNISRFFARWKPHENEFVGRLFAPVVLVALALLLYSVNVKPIIANFALLDGIDLRAVSAATNQKEQMEALQKNLRSFKKSIAAGYLGRAEAREQLTQVANQLADAPVSEDVKRDFFVFAREESREQAEEAPFNARYRLFLGTLLLSYHMPNEAIPEFEAALRVMPKKQDIYLLLGNAYLQTGNFEKTIATTLAGHELEPRNQNAVSAHAVALVYAGKVNEAEEFLKGKKRETRSIASLINAYISINRFDRVIVLWKEVIAADPENASNHVSLSAAYLEVGERGRAIEELQTAIALDPGFKAQGEEIIRDILAGRKPI